MPTPNDHPSIQDAVIADIEARKQLGIKRYGSSLKPFNNRNSLQDGYEEAMDLTLYLKQALVEQASPIKQMAIKDVPEDWEYWHHQFESWLQPPTARWSNDTQGLEGYEDWRIVLARSRNYQQMKEEK